MDIDYIWGTVIGSALTRANERKYVKKNTNWSAHTNFTIKPFICLIVSFSYKAFQSSSEDGSYVCKDMRVFSTQSPRKGFQVMSFIWMPKQTGVEISGESAQWWKTHDFSTSLKTCSHHVLLLQMSIWNCERLSLSFQNVGIKTVVCWNYSRQH